MRRNASAVTGATDATGASAATACAAAGATATSWRATELQELREALKQHLRERMRIRRKTANVEEQLEPPGLAGSGVGLPWGAHSLEAVPVACLAQSTETINHVGFLNPNPAPSAPTPIHGTHRGGGGGGGVGKDRGSEHAMLASAAKAIKQRTRGMQTMSDRERAHCMDALVSY